MKHTPVWAAALLCGLAGMAPTFQATAAPAYVVTQTVALGGPDRWDYLTFDAASHRVFVSHGDHTDVIDAGSGQMLGRLAGLHGGHGQAVTPDGRIYADSGETAQVTAFDPKTFQAGKTIPAGIDADGVIFEPHGNLVVVMDGDGQAVTLIDAATQTVHAKVKLGGAPEFGVADGTGRLYVNIASTGEIAQVDAAAGRVTARFAVPGCDEPHGLAMDVKTRRLFTTCINTRLMVLNADSGRVLQTLPIGHGTDAAVFDPVRRQVFSSNGDGTLSVFQEAADGSLTGLGDVKTAPGARAVAIDPASGRVFLATADVAGTRPGGHGGMPKYAFKPGTLKLMILDPAPK